MRTIRLNTAMLLTGLSKRSLWRRVSTSPYPTRRESHGGSRTLLAIDTILSDLPVDLDAEDLSVVERADRGDAEAQNDVALILMQAQRPDLAVGWLRLAAQEAYPEAMYWLGRCHVAGQGVDRDEEAGLEWIRRAAARGHVIAQRQMAALGRAC
ncbi:Sel1 repeat-containing protein [Ectothiorhodospira mobilis]|uniref:Sel1 repeat-containing protein n=1 Tax=Ectothiorhodospira mobilis TaxID=195064 RepID=A0A1I4RIL4_ECTMO|nr:tetratricopeptide repeat protein [Ectothiorhodospira mobilis]SFM52089.1 Sel1 repeat-containing protein [Ectothiorhodospira mobilis]